MRTPFYYYYLLKKKNLGGGAQEDGIAMKEGCTIKSQIWGGGGVWGGHAPPIVTPPLGR